MTIFKDEDLQKKLSDKYHSNASDIKFHSYDDLEENVKNQIKRIKSTPFLSNIVSVNGFIYERPARSEKYSPNMISVFCKKGNIET